MFVINKAATQGKEGESAAAYLKEKGFTVCPVTLHLRAAHKHAGNVGQTAQEFDPRGRAADESQQLYMYTMRQLTKKEQGHAIGKPGYNKA